MIHTEGRSPLLNGQRPLPKQPCQKRKLQCCQTENEESEMLYTGNANRQLWTAIATSGNPHLSWREQVLQVPSVILWKPLTPPNLIPPEKGHSWCEDDPIPGEARLIPTKATVNEDMRGGGRTRCGLSQKRSLTERVQSTAAIFPLSAGTHLQ